MGRGEVAGVREPPAVVGEGGRCHRPGEPQWGLAAGRHPPAHSGWEAHVPARRPPEPTFVEVAARGGPPYTARASCAQANGLSARVERKNNIRGVYLSFGVGAFSFYLPFNSPRFNAK